VSEWLRDCGHPAAWLSLDKNDYDPSRFLIYLIAALQRIDPEIGVDIQAALEESQSPHFEFLLIRWSEKWKGCQARRSLFLDDYHLIDSKPVHDAVNFLIEYLASNDPPGDFAGARITAAGLAVAGSGEVNEVRTSQLRFSKKEMTAFLNDRIGFDLSAEEIAALEARTEGWVASLKLAAFSMQGRDDWPEFIANFLAANRYVIDYLIDEVMARQPEAVQAFLRRTSILERFCAPLCEYIVGGIEAAVSSINLDRSNLFIIPLDDYKEWYRYHHLFADFLRQRLLLSEPGRIPELHRRAQPVVLKPRGWWMTPSNTHSLPEIWKVQPPGRWNRSRFSRAKGGV